jgi:hypothetical protein
MLIALAGNSKGERALTGMNSMAVPKSMACRRSPLDMKVVSRKTDSGHKRLPGNNRQIRSESISASIPVLTWLSERVTSTTGWNRYQVVDSAFTTGERTWCIRTDKSNGRCVRLGQKRERAETRRFGIPSLRPPGMHGHHSNCKWRRQLLDGTLLSDDIARDGKGTRIPLSI